MRDALLHILGWKGLVLHGDPMVYDRWKWLRRHLKPGNLRTLDAGCGNGCFTMYAASIGNDAYGLSYDEEQTTTAERRAKLLGLTNAHFRQMDLRQLPEHAGSLGTFDQIICTEVIEHVLDDAGLVRNLANLLKPGGRLLLTTPFEGHHALYKEKLSETEDGGHVRWGYSDAMLRKLFDACSLKTEVVEYTGGVWLQKLTTAGRIGGTRIGWAATAPFRLLNFLDAPLTMLLRTPAFGIAAVASKQAV